jgi:hypothetical protein
MARTYQVSVAPGTTTVLADLYTRPGGAAVTVRNNHATEPVMVGGDENQLGTSQGGAPLTVATGYRLPAGSTLSAVLNGGEALWAISGTSTVTISVSVFRANFRGI